MRRLPWDCGLAGHPMGASFCFLLKGPFLPLWTMNIVHMSLSLESELLGSDNKTLFGASGVPEPTQQFRSFLILNAGLKIFCCHLYLLPRKRSLMKSPWVMRLSPVALSCRDCFCCLVVSCVTAVFAFGICRERRSEEEVSLTLAIPLPAKWIQTSCVMTPPPFSHIQHVWHR